MVSRIRMCYGRSVVAPKISSYLLPNSVVGLYCGLCAYLGQSSRGRVRAAFESGTATVSPFRCVRDSRDFMPSGTNARRKTRRIRVASIYLRSVRYSRATWTQEVQLEQSGNDAGRNHDVRAEGPRRSSMAMRFAERERTDID